MRRGFRIRKKQLKLAGWQVVGDNKVGDREYHLVLRRSDGDERTITGSTRARAFMRAEQELRNLKGGREAS